MLGQQSSFPKKPTDGSRGKSAAPWLGLREGEPLAAAAADSRGDDDPLVSRSSLSGTRCSQHRLRLELGQGNVVAQIAGGCS